MARYNVVKEVSGLTGPVKDERKAEMSLLVFAEYKMEYDEARRRVPSSTVTNRDNNLDEWVVYRRGNVPHLTKTQTTAQSGVGANKGSYQEGFAVVSTLITLHEYAGDEYIVKYHRVGERKATKPVRLQDVDHVLDGSHCLLRTKPMKDALMLPFIDVCGSTEIRRYSVGQHESEIVRVPQKAKLEEALEATEMKRSDKLYCIGMSDYGYTSYSQLDVMLKVLTARKYFGTVMQTTHWMDGVE
ncbi:LOW QUALITY PROTEIN: Hypothetical protein PHPALM_20364 [Phytophthora palmivora]|uniref:Uncharacterized protein n=1 Tax=Phytophthora palmivora TaxID=4796 RepID=A0A2P4XF26_9STRA|nr:LOW QUALITY PROTEIN: Hypothetical protein PHPALM_20364 [Phytophthora palmivora]